MLLNFTNSAMRAMRLLAPIVATSVLLSGCAAVKEVNTGRGAWNAPEYVYQPAWLKRKYAKAIKPMEEGDYATSAERLEAFVTTYPGYPGANVNLAIAYDQLGREGGVLV